MRGVEEVVGFKPSDLVGLLDCAECGQRQVEWERAAHTQLHTPTELIAPLSVTCIHRLLSWAVPLPCFVIVTDFACVVSAPVEWCITLLAPPNTCFDVTSDV